MYSYTPMSDPWDAVRGKGSLATAADFGTRPEGDAVYRLLVTGSRKLADSDIVWTPLFWIVHRYGYMTLIHGHCPTGADHFADEWYENWESRAGHDSDQLALIERYPADWDLHGKAAGPIRNQQMVDLGANACFAFPTPESRGTLDCMARAWVRGIPTYVFSPTNVGAFRQLSEEEGEKLARRYLGWGS